MLADNISSRNLSCKQADDSQTNDNVVIVGEDVDLLVIMIGRSKADNIFFRKPGTKKNDSNLLSAAGCNRQSECRKILIPACNKWF